MKENPIIDLRQRLEFLGSGKSLIIFPDTKFDFAYLKERIYQYVEKGKYYEKEFKKSLSDLEPLLTKVINSIGELINTAKQGFGPDGFPLIIPWPLKEIDKQILSQELESEINCYIELFEIITDKRIQVKNDKKIATTSKESKRKYSIFNTSKKPSEKQIDELINLLIEIDGTEDIELINLEVSINVPEFFTSTDLEKINQKIQFTATTYIVVFVFWWLKQMGFTNSPYTIFDTERFLSSDGKILKSGNIRSTVTTRKADFEKAYTSKKPAKIPPIPISADIPQVLARLNWQLHEIFS